MRIGILSRNASLYSTDRLLQAGLVRGHHVRVIDYLRCSMNITSEGAAVLYQGESLQGFDAIIPRIGASRASYGTAVVRQFEIMGIFTANGSEAIARSHDKLRCLQLLAQRGIALPATGFAHSAKDLDTLIRSVGGAPLVVKLLTTQGIGAILAETHQAAESVVEAFQGLEANSLVQAFIREASGCSLRCFVIGGKVVAAMRRLAPPGEFRSNLHRGGTAELVKLSREERRVAVKAATALGLDVAGVDLLRSSEGPLVMAVNSSPELEAIEQATDVDVAGRIYSFLEEHLAPREKRVEEPVPLVPAIGL